MRAYALDVGPAVVVDLQSSSSEARALADSRAEAAKEVVVTRAGPAWWVYLVALAIVAAGGALGWRLRPGLRLRPGRGAIL